MHGLSNRVLGIVSTMQLGALLDAKVLVDWRMDDSKFIGASMRELFNMSELPAFAGPFGASVNRRRRLGRRRPATTGSGGRAGTRPAAAAASPAGPRGGVPRLHGGGRRPARPALRPAGARASGGAPVVARRLRRTSTRRPPSARARARARRTGFWVCRSGRRRAARVVRVRVPARGEALGLVRWLPPSTLGVHVRRGNLDAAWARATDASGSTPSAALAAGLEHVFRVRRRRLHETFAARYGDTLLPRFEDLPSSKRVAVAGARGVPRATAATAGPFVEQRRRVVSLAEQLSLRSADAVLGTWGSTFSSVAAAWFDRPVDYVPAPRDAACVASEAEAAACPWRGKAHYPTAESSWRFGANVSEAPAAQAPAAPRRRPRRKRRPWLS
ncbi:hypothetical protein JL721_7796 [Aureococcus anophagefferens]|nr:hypothetical protein JL721_7796 [Aureococcus anophagefferens]